MKRIAFLLAVLISTFSMVAQTNNHSSKVAKNLDVFNAIYKNLDLLYVDTLDANEVVGYGINSMLHSLDPYTEYYTKEKNDELNTTLTGKYAGIGALIKYNNQLKNVVIDQAYANTPAAEAGLKKGDIILSIDDKPMAGKDNSSQKVVNAVKLSGKLTDSEYDHLAEDHKDGHHDHEDGEEHKHAHEFNEHLWYDFDTMKKVATEVAEDLAQLDSAHADSYRENAKKLGTELDALDSSAKKIDGKGKKYISTEPVPDYLIASTGAENANPEEFAESIEAEKDVPALVLKETQDLVTEKQVSLVAYNEQTETSQTKEVLQTAKDAGVAHVSFTETLPENTDYLSWMKTNVSNLEKALS